MAAPTARIDPATSPVPVPVPASAAEPDRPARVDPVRRVLLTGVSGYIGGRLAPRLAESGIEVVGISRSPGDLPDSLTEHIEAVEADVGDPDSVAAAAEGVDVAYFFVHSLGADDFEERDRRLAASFRIGCERAGVGRIVYLGGLGDESDDLSPHLRSRQEVGRVLAAGSVPVTELRAALVIGSGSASFEMLRWLTEVLPVMVVPRWVRDTRCQPTAVDDVLDALVAAAHRQEPGHDVLELGGADVLTYAEMMQCYAEVAELPRRRILPVPVLSPGLSSHWVSLVTPLPGDLARDLVHSLVNDVVVRRRPAADALGLQPVGLAEAIHRSLARVEDLEIPTHWTDDGLEELAALPEVDDPSWAGGTVLQDVRRVDFDPAGDPAADGDRVWRAISMLGGRRGWPAGRWLWEVRGLLDKVFGGVGLRRGRRDPEQLRRGDVLDFWRVDEIDPGRFLRLRAEMKLPGDAWLEWEIDHTGVEQRARYVPRGLWGRAYWFVLLPVHAYLFPRLLDRLVAGDPG